MQIYFGGGSGNLLADRRFEMAQGLAEWGEHGAAADLLTETCDMVPLWPPIYFQLGEYSRLANRENNALTAFKNILNLIRSITWAQKSNSR